MAELDGESLLSLDIEEAGDDAVGVRLAGELDMSNVGRLAAAVEPLLACHPKRLIVEARDLEFADSSAITLWLRWAAEVDRFEIRELSPLLRRVLTAMGLDSRLELS